MDPLTLFFAVIGTLGTLIAAVFGWPAFEAWLKAKREAAIELPATQSTYERVISSKQLRVGCITASPWFGTAEPGKNPCGIYPTIFDDIAARNELNMCYIPVRNNVTIKMLDEGSIDVVASLLITPERAKRADFVSLIHNVALVAVKRRGNNEVTVLGDLKSKPIRCAAVKGEIGAEVASKYYDMTVENDRLIEVDTSDVPSIFYHVHNGTVDVTITTGARWIEFQKRDPEAASTLELAFKRPLLLVPAGCLIKAGERQFAEWLDDEMDTSRAKEPIKIAEQAFLAEFNDAVEQM